MGDGPETVAEMGLEHERDAVALCDQLHDGREIAGIEHVVEVDAVLAQIGVHDLARALLGLHEQDALLFQTLQIDAGIAVVGIGFGKAAHGVILLRDHHLAEALILQLRIERRGLAVEGDLHAAVQNAQVVLVGETLMRTFGCSFSKAGSAQGSI